MKRLFIVGIGPGAAEHLTPAAQQVLATATDLVGYGAYLELLGTAGRGKRHHALALGQEVERARLALDLAGGGHVTALVSSGDPGIYAMATVVFELLAGSNEPAWREVEVQVIPGLSALQLAAARTGAPLAHDFCTISLSDLLTPWERIEARLHAAGQGDFVAALYNPVSQRRRWQLPRALAILQCYRNGDTPVVVARNLTRPAEQVTVTSLAEVDLASVDMLTILLIGNRETRRAGPWVYTPRGYTNVADTAL